MITKILKRVYIVLSLIIAFTTIYIKINFYEVSFEQLLNSVEKNEGTSFMAIKSGLIFVIIGIFFFFIIFYIFKKIVGIFKYKFYFDINVKTKKEVRINILPSTNFQRRVYCVLFFCFSIIFCCWYLGIFKYLIQQREVTMIFDDYYVNGRELNIGFPEKKRNLIYIFVESLESTNFTIANGGILRDSYIPNLEKYAAKYINFSNTSLLGGGYETIGATWTIGGLVSQTSGIPLKYTVGNQYKGYGEFLPGVYAIGDILKDNGYNNYFMIGSDASFGGRRDYFSYHGDYEICDYLWAKENKKIPEDYKEWWGYEDSKLFSFAKDKLMEISKNNEPFNFTILTADTHFTDGYLDKSCPEKFDIKYANAFNCTDILLDDFLKWIMEQDFYENTTIVISGDHLTMQKDFYDVDSNYSRTVYNVFINSAISTTNNKNRIFATFDMYPTTLAAMGVNIEGNRIGLGTNLFSDRKTLAEELSIDYLNQEFIKRSNYYNLKLLGGSYFELEKKLGDDN